MFKYVEPLFLHEPFMLAKFNIYGKVVKLHRVPTYFAMLVASYIDVVHLSRWMNQYQHRPFNSLHEYWLTIRFFRISLILDLCNVFFLMRLGQSVGGRETHREKWHLITLSQVHTMNRFIPVEVNLDHLAEVQFARFLCCEGILFLPFPVVPFGRNSLCTFLLFLPPSRPHLFIYLFVSLFIPFFLSFNQSIYSEWFYISGYNPIQCYFLAPFPPWPQLWSLGDLFSCLLCSFDIFFWFVV